MFSRIFCAGFQTLFLAGYKQMHVVFISPASESLSVQENKLNEVIEDWKWDVEQIDDSYISGVKI